MALNIYRHRKRRYVARHHLHMDVEGGYRSAVALGAYARSINSIKKLFLDGSFLGIVAPLAYGLHEGLL